MMKYLIGKAQIRSEPNILLSHSSVLYLLELVFQFDFLVMH